MAKVSFSDVSINDLQLIKAYITNDLLNDKVAEDIIIAIYRKIYLLEEFPDMGSPLSSIVNIKTDYRFLVCGNYLVFYKHEDENVYIVRVIYKRRNFVNILFNDNH